MVQKMMHHTKQDALSMQLLGWPATYASLAGTGGGHLDGVAPVVLGIALKLSGDAAGRAFKLLKALGWDVVHDRTLLDW
jgi:hypothetical protein